MRGPALSVALLALLVPAASHAGPPHHHEGTPPPGRPRAIPHTHERAGYPLCPAPHQQPTKTPGGFGYYVGGGTHHAGDPRCPHEGTWGYDDTGGHLLPFRNLVRLNWSHGRKYQGGTGAYATEIGEGRE